jgi:branched-chain amino acid transport system substrate-binding protein
MPLADADLARRLTLLALAVEAEGEAAHLEERCGTTTDTTLALISVLEEAAIPSISLAGGIKIIEPVKPVTLKTPNTDRIVYEKILDALRTRGLTRVGLISGTDGFGASMRTQ